MHVALSSPRRRQLNHPMNYPSDPPLNIRLDPTPTPPAAADGGVRRCRVISRIAEVIRILGHSWTNRQNNFIRPRRSFISSMAEINSTRHLHRPCSQRRLSSSDFLRRPNWDTMAGRLAPRFAWPELRFRLSAAIRSAIWLMPDAVASLLHRPPPQTEINWVAALRGWRVGKAVYCCDYWTWTVGRQLGCLVNSWWKWTFDTW